MRMCPARVKELTLSQVYSLLPSISEMNTARRVALRSGEQPWSNGSCDVKSTMPERRCKVVARARKSRAAVDPSATMPRNSVGEHLVVASRYKCRAQQTILQSTPVG